MALGATVYNFKIELADSDRGVYAPLDLRVARHPSETEEHLLTRVLAYCLEYTEGISFSNGLSDSDRAAISVRDLTGAPRGCIVPQSSRHESRYTRTRMPSSSPPAWARRRSTAPTRWNCMPWIRIG